MRGCRALPTLALAVLLAAAPAFAQEEDALRPCRRADLIGFWQVIRFGFAIGAAVDRSDPAYRVYQRYVFNGNATMAYSASDVLPSPDEHRVLLLAPSTMTWSLDDEGRLLRQDAGAPGVSRSECRVVTRQLRDPRSTAPALPGDVLLTDQDEDERPITRRLLRKVWTGE